MASRRRLFAQAALAVGASVLGIIACSSDHPASSDGSPYGSTTSSSGTNATTSSSGSMVVNDAASEDAGSDSSSTAMDAGEEPQTPCVGDTPIANDAGALPTSCPESASCSAWCEKMAKNYRVGLAQTAIDCFRKLPSCDDEPPVFHCFTDTMALACTDATATTFCAPLASACAPDAGELGAKITTESCASFVTALNADGRATFKACIDDKIQAGTCAEQVGDCFAALE